MNATTDAHPEHDATLTLITGPGEDDVRQETIEAGTEEHGAALMDAVTAAHRAIGAGEAESAFLRYLNTDGEERVIIVRLHPYGVSMRNVPGEDVPV